MMPLDVPSPIDLRDIHDAREWEATAMSKRPWRLDFFDAIASSVADSGTPQQRVLELGSGPGFLARRLLERLPDIAYVALDFSPAMHELANARLGALHSRVEFVERSFLDANWVDGLGRFECVVTNQAVHELRHKSRTVALHQQVLQVLQPGGRYLVCDHFVGEGGMSNDQLYMSVDEQRQALVDAGFPSVSALLQKGGLVLHLAMAA